MRPWWEAITCLCGSDTFEDAHAHCATLCEVQRQMNRNPHIQSSVQTDHMCANNHAGLDDGRKYCLTLILLTGVSADLKGVLLSHLTGALFYRYNLTFGNPSQKFSIPPLQFYGTIYWVTFAMGPNLKYHLYVPICYSVSYCEGFADRLYLRKKLQFIVKYYVKQNIQIKCKFSRIIFFPGDIQYNS